jgi:phosphatidylinositol-3-phosphatase
MKGRFCFLFGAALCFGPQVRAQAPAFDHIVIVIEENHSFGQIIGSAQAPNINALAASGANIVNAASDPQGNSSGAHAVRHPSQPNYLELYSGSNQGTIGDGHPGSASEPFSPVPPFTTPNLGAALRNAGYSYATYSQSLPSVGYDGNSFGNYRRKHNPAANWMKDVSPTANQLPSSTNQLFTTFQSIGSSPGSFANLPTVSLVVPDQQYDMHDGTIATADTWLKNNILDTYLEWAKTHNSLLIVTWDEDADNTATNHIPTIFAGANVIPGNYTEANLNANNPHVAAPMDPGTQTPSGTAMNHYNVLSTIEDIYGLTHIGGSINRRPLTDIFAVPIIHGPLVVPNEWSSAQGDAGNLFPLFSSQPIRYQQVFDARQFARWHNGGGLINRIAFRGHGPGIPFTGTIPQLQVNLSTTLKLPDGLSSTFADNVGADDTQVFSGPFQTAVTFTGDATNFEIVINFTMPFFYDPAQGNLLLDVRNGQGSTEVPPNDQKVDGTSAAGDATSRVYHYGDATAPSAGSEEKDSYGLITRFDGLNAVSRKAHGNAGNFDIGLPLLGNTGIECRDGGPSGDYQIVVTFPTAVTIADAQVTEGTGSVSGTTRSDNQVFVGLTGVTNAQTIKITLVGVNDGVVTNDVTIPMVVLIGDTTANSTVNSTDVSATKAQSGHAIGAGNFRDDVSANGVINSSDVSLVKSNSGTGVITGTASERLVQDQK